MQMPLMAITCRAMLAAVTVSVAGIAAEPCRAEGKTGAATTATGPTKDVRAFRGDAVLASDGNLFAARIAGGRLRIWDTHTGEPRCDIDCPCDDEERFYLALPPKADCLMALFAYQRRAIAAKYDTRSGREISRAVVEGYFLDLDTGKRVAFADDDQYIRFCQASKKGIRFVGGNVMVNGLTGYSFSPDGNNIWVTEDGIGDSNVHVCRVNTRDGKVEAVSYAPASYEDERYYDTIVGVSPRADEVLVTGKPYGFTLFDSRDHRPLRHSNNVVSPAFLASLTFHPSRHEIAYARESVDLGIPRDDIGFIDLQRGMVIRKTCPLPRSSRITSMTYSSKGVLFAGTAGGEVFRVSEDKVECVARINDEKNKKSCYTLVACTSDGTLIVARVAQDRIAPAVSQWDATARTPTMIWQRQLDTSAK